MLTNFRNVEEFSRKERETAVSSKPFSIESNVSLIVIYMNLVGGRIRFSKSIINVV